MGMLFSLHLVPDDLNLIVKRTRYAEEHGFDQVWIAESHLTCRDHNVALTLATLATCLACSLSTPQTPSLSTTSLSSRWCRHPCLGHILRPGESASSVTSSQR